MKKQVQIDYSLFVKLLGYFSLIEDPSDREKEIENELTRKAERLIAHDEFSKNLLSSVNERSDKTAP